MNGKNLGPNHFKLTMTENYYTANNMLKLLTMLIFIFYPEAQQFYSMKKLFFYSAIGKTKLIIPNDFIKLYY